MWVTYCDCILFPLSLPTPSLVSFLVLSLSFSWLWPGPFTFFARFFSVERSF